MPTGRADELLNVRETAAMLHVHENTIRNWVASGILADARLPGSRFHRFRRTDVIQLMEQRGRSVLTVKEDRQSVGPDRITANDLVRWAGTVSARHRFPELMRRLLASTPGVTSLNFRTDEGVDLPGWDGWATSDGSPYLPKGLLRFELSVSADVGAKASRDFAARTSDLTSDDVFVFATPRRWAGSIKWAKERRRQQAFADVVVLDADNIAGWLAQTPSVHVWISEELGRRPRDAQTIDMWWRRFSSATHPTLPTELFLAGREQHASRLRAHLAGPPAAIVLQADWTDDARAFVHAATHGVDEADDRQVLIVDSPAVYDRIVSESAAAVVIPTFANVDVDRAVTEGHHILLITDASSATTRPPDVQLPRLDRQQAETALAAVGVHYPRTSEYASHARRNLQGFIRSISKDPRLVRPEWSRPPQADVMARLALVGSWTDATEDVAFLEQLTGRTYDQVEDMLLAVPANDPVFRKTGGLWSLTSPSEAFELLIPMIQSKPKIAHDWLAMAVDAGDGRALANRPAATDAAVSALMRRSIATSAVLLSKSVPDATFTDGTNARFFSDRLVGRLVTEALGDATGRQFASISDVLPMLAEAAPEVFLELVQADLRRTDSTIVVASSNAGAPSLTFGPSNKLRLLWALETLCWSPEHLLPAVRVLAALAKRAPASRTNDSPVASLARVLCGWSRNTSAPLDQRVAAVDAVRSVDSQVCWDLVIGLWPERHAVTFPPHTPYLKSWIPDSSSVPISEWAAFAAHLVRVGVELTESVPLRIVALVERLHGVARNDRASLLGRLHEVAIGEWVDSEERFQLWERLRSLVGKHEQFPDADWVYDHDTLEAIRSAMRLTRPQGDAKRYAWLFDWRPNLPDVKPRSGGEYVAAVETMRAHALQSISMSLQATDQLTELVRHAPVPRIAGMSIADSTPAEWTTLLLEWLSETEGPLLEAAFAWAARRGTLPDAERWLKQTLDASHLVGEARRRFLAAIPLKRSLWTVIEQDATDAAHYWKTAAPYSAYLEDSVEAARALLRSDRPWAAVDVLADALDDGEPSDGSGSRVELVLAALSVAATAEARADFDDQASHSISVLLDYLDEQEAVDSDALATFEFAFFWLLDHVRPTKALDAALARRPEVFVDLARRIYRGRHDEVDSDSDPALAQHAWWVLHRWRGFPGRNEDGSVDAAALVGWVRTARTLFAESDRSDVGDQLIGEAFGYAPAGDDGMWPSEPVREVIELVASPQFDNGFVLGKINSRGVTTRGIFDGGYLERKEAAKYNAWSAKVRAAWPRTGRILRHIAEDYERDARRLDLAAEANADAN